MKVQSHVLSPSAARGLAIMSVAVLVASAHMAAAGINTWTRLDVRGGPIYALAIDPNAPGTLYAGTYGNDFGVFKSTDGGNHWKLINAGLNGLNARFIFALLLDPTTPGTLYAGTGGGVYTSTDGGDAWNATSNGLSDSVYALAIEPAAAHTLYAGTQGSGVFKSTDGGSTWVAFQSGLTDLAIFALAIDPTTPSTLLAGTGSGVFSIQQVAVCTGDCSGARTVAINNIIALVNIALGSAQPSACASGVPIGADVTVAVIIQAVNNALSGCPAEPTPIAACMTEFSVVAISAPAKSGDDRLRGKMEGERS